MIRMPSLMGWALLLGTLSLSGCGVRKGDLGSERLDYTPTKPATDGVQEEPKAVAAADQGEVKTEAPSDTAEAQPADVAMSAAPEPGAAPASDSTEVKAETVPVTSAPAAAAPAAGDVAAAKPVLAAEAQPVAAPAAAPGDEQPPAPPAPTAAPGDEQAPTPPAPAPAPVEESPEQKAERLLQEALKHRTLDQQAKDAGAEAEFQAGMRLYNDLEYEAALKHLESAVRKDPANAKAQEYLHRVKAALGLHLDHMRERVRELEQVERVKIQEALVALANALEEGRMLENKGSSVSLENESADRERILADQLEGLRQAQDRYRRVKEILNYMPPTIDLPRERKVVEEALLRVRQKLLDKDDEISFLRRKQAMEIAEQTRMRETEIFRARVKKLNEQVADLYAKQQFTDCEKLALRVLQIDPFNEEAENWKRKARTGNHGLQALANPARYAEEVKNTWELVDTSHIPYGNMLTYPLNWDMIARRTEHAAIGKSKVEDVWKQDVRKKLQRKVSFEFVDTPLEEAIQFLRSLTNVTMVVDPKVVQGGAIPPISLKVTDMSLELALEWLLKLADLDYALKDQAIFISKKQQLVEDVELRIYDVSDLTQVVPDFPGPEFQLVTAGDETVGAAGGNPFIAAPQPTVTVQSIADMIRNRVKPDSWDPTQGTSIEERAGKLVVMQRPEVHALIDQLLSNFRATQKILVNVESRFLAIREAYLEEIGVEFNGLDPNVLTGDFGDINRVGGVAGALASTRQPNGAGADGINVPWPGYVDGPNPLLGGAVSTVGAIVNHVINFFPRVLDNSGDTISALDTSGALRRGGLSAQITLLGKAQVQAFIRALGISENTTQLMAPRLTLFNTQRAHMFVAVQRSYIADYDISGDAYDPVIRQFLVGAVLDVRPTVSSDRKYVTMELRPTVTELANFSTRFIASFTVLQGANVTIIVPLTFPIQFPELSIRRVRTTATSPDGGILLIGGMQRNTKFHAETGVPFLSDLPIIGRLFRYNTVENAKANLAILISPRIILFNEEEAKL